MRVVSFIIALVALTVSYSHLGRLNTCEQRAEKWGYIDKTGTMVIKPRFAYAGDFNENGLAFVEWGNCCMYSGKSDKCGYGIIDREGNLVAEIDVGDRWVWKFDSFRDGLAMVTLTAGNWGWKAGYVNTRGEWVVDPKYDASSYFWDDRAMIQICEGDYETCRTGFVDKTGKVVIEPVYIGPAQFSEGLAAVNENPEFHDNFFRAEFKYIDVNNNVVFEGPFREARLFINGRAYVRKCTRDAVDGSINVCESGWLDRDGSFTHFPDGIKYDSEVGENLISVEFLDKDRDVPSIGLMDRENNIITGPRFCKIEVFRDGLAVVKVCDRCLSQGNTCKRGLINKKGEYVVEPEYSWVENFSEGMAVVINHNIGTPDKYRFINTYGEMAFSTGFLTADSFSEGLAAVRKCQKETVYVITDHGSVLTLKPEASFRNSKYSTPGAESPFIHICNENLLGFIDNSGNIVIGSTMYSDTSGFSEGLAAVSVK